MQNGNEGLLSIVLADQGKMGITLEPYCKF